MAQRRMFSKEIIDSDAFIEMPISTRLLYYDLGMRGDDDGFVNNPKKIVKFTGASDDDLKILWSKKFIIPFESGVIVIKHWRMNNYIRSDRYKETNYKNELAKLELDENGAYRLKDSSGIPCGIPNVTERYTQVRLGKVSKEQYDVHLFEDLWDDYPCKIGKKEAYRHYKASVKTDDDERDIKKALSNYKRSKRVANNKIQNGSTWFNNWKDWIEMPKSEIVCLKCNGKGVYMTKGEAGTFERRCDCVK